MANCSDKIFEILGIAPGEEFGLKEYPTMTFKITPRLRMYLKNGCGEWRSTESELFLGILAGDFDIQKYVFTNSELAVLKAYWIMGYKYIAKDGNNKVWAYVDKPIFDLRAKKWYPPDDAKNDSTLEIDDFGDKKLFKGLTSREPLFIGDLKNFL